MNSVSEERIENLYDVSANTAIIVQQVISGLCRVLITDIKITDDVSRSIQLLKELGVTDVIIAACVASATQQMIANVDILNVASPTLLERLGIVR